MKVTTISANIRFSREVRRGVWKSVEVAATATLDETDPCWREAELILYDDLREQLKENWKTTGESRRNLNGGLFCNHYLS